VWDLDEALVLEERATRALTAHVKPAPDTERPPTVAKWLASLPDTAAGVMLPRVTVTARSQHRLPPTTSEMLEYERDRFHCGGRPLACRRSITTGRIPKGKYLIRRPRPSDQSVIPGPILGPHGLVGPHGSIIDPDGEPARCHRTKAFSAELPDSRWANDECSCKRPASRVQSGRRSDDHARLFHFEMRSSAECLLKRENTNDACSTGKAEAASIGANECGGNKKAFGINNWRKSLTCDAREFNLSAVARYARPRADCVQDLSIARYAPAIRAEMKRLFGERALQVSEVATSEVRAELMRLVDGAAAAPAVSLPAPPPGAGGTRSTSTNIFPSLWYTKV